MTYSHAHGKVGGFIFATSFGWCIFWEKNCRGNALCWYAFERKGVTSKFGLKMELPILTANLAVPKHPILLSTAFDVRNYQFENFCWYLRQHDWYLQIWKVPILFLSFSHSNLSIQHLLAWISARRAHCLVFVILLLVLKVFTEEMNHIPPCRIGGCLRILPFWEMSQPDTPILVLGNPEGWFAMISWGCSMISWGFSMISWRFSMISWVFSMISWRFSMISWGFSMISLFALGLCNFCSIIDHCFSIQNSSPAAGHLNGVECIPKCQHIAARMTYPPLFACILWDM